MSLFTELLSFNNRICTKSPCNLVCAGCERVRGGGGGGGRDREYPAGPHPRVVEPLGPLQAGL